MKNIIYTKGFINDNGDIEVPGVFFEDGAKVNLAISTENGRFEIGLFPSYDLTEDDSPNNDCGISEETIEEYCQTQKDCTDCLFRTYCDKQDGDEYEG